MAQSLWHYNFATVHHRVVYFSAKCSGRMRLHEKYQCLYTAIECSLFCCWQVNSSKTVLTATSGIPYRKARKAQTTVEMSYLILQCYTVLQYITSIDSIVVKYCYPTENVLWVRVCIVGANRGIWYLL